MIDDQSLTLAVTLTKIEVCLQNSRPTAVVGIVTANHQTLSSTHRQDVAHTHPRTTQIQTSPPSTTSSSRPTNLSNHSPLTQITTAHNVEAWVRLQSHPDFSVFLDKMLIFLDRRGGASGNKLKMTLGLPVSVSLRYLTLHRALETNMPGQTAEPS